jgi:hypothetical protein
MQFLATAKFRIVRWSLTAFLALAACSRIEASDRTAPARSPERAAQKSAVAPVPAAPSPSPSLVPTQPGRDDLGAFEQALARKFDPARMSTRPAPGGGILHVPNGRAAHAAVLVRNPDGTLRRECISSSAEASALVKQLRDGAAQ